MSSDRIENQPQPAPLADRIVQAARGGENFSAFHEEINGLTNEQRLQLVRDLSSNGGASSNNGQSRLLADATIDTTNGQLVDIDLVDVNNDTGVRTRHDLYTPGEAGEQYDRRQHLQERLAPYEELFRLSLEDDSDDARRSAFFETAQVLNKDILNSPDRHELYRVFKERTLRPDVNTFKSVNPSDSSTANRANLDKASPLVRERIEDLRNDLENSSTLYGRSSW